jgi:hypothetical protein
MIVTTKLDISAMIDNKQIHDAKSKIAEDFLRVLFYPAFTQGKDQVGPKGQQE